MKNVLDTLSKLQYIVDNIEEIAIGVVVNEREFISELNREQLLSGTKSDGEVTGFYSQRSKQPSAPGKITLFDTGDFYDGISPLFEDSGFDLVGLDIKTSELIERYGEEILGLTKESIENLIEHIRPLLIFKIKSLL